MSQDFRELGLIKIGTVEPKIKSFKPKRQNRKKKKEKKKKEDPENLHKDRRGSAGKNFAKGVN